LQISSEDDHSTLWTFEDAWGQYLKTPQIISLRDLLFLYLKIGRGSSVSTAK
jgi:hypothetical protein